MGTSVPKTESVQTETQCVMPRSETIPTPDPKRTRPSLLSVLLPLLAGLATGTAWAAESSRIAESAPNVWLKLYEQKPSDAVQFQRQEHGGSCFDSRTGRLVLIGSNTHGRDWHNSPRFFDPVNCTWSQAYADDEFGTYAVNAEGIAVAGAKGDHPWTMHTFGAVVYDSSREEIVIPIFDDHLVPGRFTDVCKDLWPAIQRKPTWTYRVESGKWTPLAGEGVNCFPYCAVYDSDRKMVVAVMPDGIHELAGEPRTWKKITKGGFFGWHTNCAYDSRNKAVVVFGSNENRNDIAAYVPATGDYKLMPTPGTRPPKDQHTPMEFCPDIGRTVVLVDRIEGNTQQTETWLYDLAEDAWTQVNSATLPFACGMNYNLEYSPSQHCLLLVTGPNPTVWALRLDPPQAVAGNNAARPGEIQVEPSTLHCLAVRWPVMGDENGNCTVEVAYRKRGTSEWKQGYPLLRTTGAATDAQRKQWSFTKGNLTPGRVPGGRLFAGSIVDLAPATEYDVRLALKDPDGGSVEKTVTSSTIAEPREPAGMRLRHVVPGNGGGTGTQSDPFRGLPAAIADARSGDLVLLHGGVYATPSTLELTRSGTAEKPIIFRGSGDGEAVIDGGGDGENKGRLISAGGMSHIWLEDLTLQGREYILVAHESSHLVIRRCRFQKMTKGIVAHNGGYYVSQGHFISDNTFTGPTTWPRTKGIEEYAGICISGAGHVIGYNRFSNLGDGIHGTGYGNLSASDIHNNDFSVCTDDGIEADYSETNVRVFRNRIVNVAHGISAQPAQGGPLYFFRNVIYNATYSPFKLHNDTCGVLLFHNTCLRSGPCWPIQPGTETVTDISSRNNLFIGTGEIALDTSGRMIRCDFDNDGYGGFAGAFAKWNGTVFQTPLDAKAAGGPYRSTSIVINPAKCFTGGMLPPAMADKEYATDALDFRLSLTADAVDKGIPLPNFSDGYLGNAPDLGALEAGGDLPVYGPRPTSAPTR